ncbi:hypothetical protein [Bdellovibrio bacteriovorus]|uniref:hypothetical protein n=1 Tax=Bdellovibrio TaxID=958 RepID=UPI0035A9969C
MKINKTYIFVVMLTPVLLFGFQNCSKLGTNGIAVSDQKLSLEAIDIAEPVADVEEPGADPVKDIEEPKKEVPSNGGSTTPDNAEDVSQPTTPTALEDIEDTEVAGAIKACQASEPLTESVYDLDLKFNHESIKVDVQRVTALNGNYGSYVLVRASEDSGVAQSIHINNTTLILCNFAQIENIKGTQNRIIVVGGNIQDAQLNNSTLALVNAEAASVKGPNTIIKRYSLK